MVGQIAGYANKINVQCNTLLNRTPCSYLPPYVTHRSNKLLPRTGKCRPVIGTTVPLKSYSIRTAASANELCNVVGFKFGIVDVFASIGVA